MRHGVAGQRCRALSRVDRLGDGSPIRSSPRSAPDSLVGTTFALVAALALTAGCSGATSASPAGSSRSTTAGAPASRPTTTASSPSTRRSEKRAPRALRFRAAPGIRVGRGFRAEIYASGLVNPTALAYGPDGRLYVAEMGGDVVVAAPRTTRPRTFARGFPTPLGLAWKGRTLYVSAQGRLERVRLSGRRATGRRVVLSNLPFGLHQQDNVVVGPDGRLYLGSGSTCNACAEPDPRSAAILSFRPDGSGLEVFATGLRNPFGLAFQPGTGRLYVSVNGRDDLPSPSSPEPAEMVVIAKRGANFGWPACWPSFREKRMVGTCAGVTPPAAYLEPHSSADGLAFYTGSSFPATYRDNLFVALWGQYSSTRYGRRVVRIALARNGNARRGGVSTFADGFDHPLALAIDPHGALLVADWGRGTIYRIQAAGRP